MDWQEVSGSYRNANHFLYFVGIPAVEGEILQYSTLNKNTKHFAEATSYVAVRHYDGSVSAVVVLMTHRKEHGDKYFFRIMGEEECPFYFDCPQEIFDRLSPLTPDSHENAVIWRRYCENNLQKNSKKVSKNA